ncbi:pyruvate dehydrogenase (acetyl-transferring) E1 component subunit alpha [Gemmatimonas phototrophica]|jgi:pyruvate dehydrogenase E1 component alpha subunit|uniref:Pyruvate dehydrogenase E1 component subunit alpha n=1 Tax=Gemmatimonas phototrophica TaxID=1379270 RepID=A0A143BI97_9BACT|nr:pyruvate dehydrogenase (acetyl-transferring) E1 component subunit alpha [Gemmatimonas phototrophica]AMW04311.1 dehydrogenase [Gemmatimonas phototrophica]
MPPKKKSDPQVTVKTDNTAALHKELLYSMLLQRRFEERTAEMYAIGRIGGFCHLYIGQEAVSTGIISLLRPDDYIITTYRDHGQALARGMTPRAVMAELFGRQDGCAKGKGGSMHMFDKQLGFLGGHGIVGGHVPIASGVGFAIRYRGGDQVIACFMGESVVNTGAFHEALNMAALWKLPCIFIIENNRYGMGTALERASSIHDIYKRGASYDMPRDVVDGQDVMAVRKATAEAIERARKESMPTLLEIRTYRFMGHSMSDAVSGTYRTKEELEQYLKRDPISLHRQRMEEAGEITAAEVTAMDEEIKKIVQESIDFAEASPELPLEALMEDILVETTS